MTTTPDGLPPLPYTTLRTTEPRPKKNWIAFSVGVLVIAIALVVTAVVLNHQAPATSQPQTAEQQYVSFAVPRLPNADETSVTNLGYSICQGRRTGLTFAQVTGAMQTTTDLSDADATRIASLAIAAYCPEYSN